MSTRWAMRIMRLLPMPVARWWRKRRFEAIRKRDGDDVVFRRICDALELEPMPDGTMREKPRP